MKKMSSYLLPSSLIIGVIILAYFKLLHHHEIWNDSFLNGDAVIIGFYLVWLVYEVTVSHKDIKQEMVISDYGTRELYGLSHALTIFSALWFDPLWHKPGICHGIGFIVFILGVFFRLWAIHTLGQYYSHIVRKITDHKIIDTGPYRLIRHPAYTGMIIAHSGITIFYFNYVTLLIFLLLLVPSIIVRIIIEEKTLIKIDGYAEFSKHKKRIIPFVW